MPQTLPDTATSTMLEVLQDLWSTTAIEDVFQVIAEGVTRYAGWGVAGLSFERGGQMRVVAVAGPGEVREAILGKAMPMPEIERLLRIGERWGALCYIPGDVRLESDEAVWTASDYERLDAADAWDVEDALIAPLYDREGRLRGSLSVDLPVDRRRPGPRRRRLLETYVEQAQQALQQALEREALLEEVRMADAARLVVRNATENLSVAGLFEACSTVVMEGFRLRGVYLRSFAAGLEPVEVVLTDPYEDVVVPQAVLALLDARAERAWAARSVDFLREEAVDLAAVPAEDVASVQTLFRPFSSDVVMLVPMGVGEECFGWMGLAHDESGASWSELEQQIGIDLGHDLGRAVANARIYARERRLVEELTRLDSYKSQLIATVSHELRTPLTAIKGHTELLEDAVGEAAAARRSLGALTRSSDRMLGLVEDLLELSRVANPSVAVVREPVDLAQVVGSALTTVCADAARSGSIEVDTDLGDEPLVVLGDPAQLERVWVNLIGNAIKYSEPGGKVSVRGRRGERGVLVSVRDWGIGIAPDDRGRLFTEFFRTTNPRALSRPGTGLGLTIVKQIVERHEGTIEVASELGRGSTFTVLLPVPS